MLIIRRYNCNNATPVICHSVRMAVWYAGLDETVSYHPAYQTAIHTVTNNRCRIDTVLSPDDGHIFARNIYRIEINIQEKLRNSLVLFTSLGS